MDSEPYSRDVPSTGSGSKVDDVPHHFGSGMHHPKFLAVLTALSPAPRRCAGLAAPAPR